jgi:uroporphyrinogen decarboxylase
MNSKERVITAFERKIPDRVPHFELLIDSKVMNDLVPGSDLFDFTDAMDLDAITVRASFKREKIGDNLYKDEKGQILLKGETQDYYELQNRVIKTQKDLDGFEFPDPKSDFRLKELRKAVKRFKGKKAIVLFLRDGWAEARDLHGFQETLMDLVDNIKLIKGIVDKAVDYYSELGKIAASIGCDIGLSGDDISGVNGMLMSPYHFKEIIYPAMKRLYKNWRKSGLYIMKHTDGNIYPVMDLILDTGIDCLHPIDPLAGMDLGYVKDKWGKKICIMGNVNCAGSLVFGSSEEVTREVKKCIDLAAPGGGYICSSSNSIPRSVKPQNYSIMVKTIKEYGVYNGRAI